MRYIDALKLINLCVQNNILKEIKGNILLYREGTPNSKEGWYLTDKDIVAKELMKDEEGQKKLVLELKKRNVEFIIKD